MGVGDGGRARIRKGGLQIGMLRIRDRQRGLWVAFKQKFPSAVPMGFLLKIRK